MASVLGSIGSTSFVPKAVPALRTQGTAIGLINNAGFPTTSVVGLFGGQQTHTSTRLNDTWTMPGQAGTFVLPGVPIPSLAWQHVKTATTPAARSRHSLAYNSTNRYGIMFGGFDGSTVLSDTYKLDLTGTIWTLQSPSTVPTARQGHASAYRANGTTGVVIYGGENSGGTLLQSGFRWDNATSNWVAVGTTATPLARKNAVMWYNPTTTAQTLMFGGQTLLGVVDTVLYALGTANTWTTPGLLGFNNPTARQGHAIAYDVRNGYALMFGGDDGAGAYNSETWTIAHSGSTNYTSTILTPTVSPAPRSGHTMCFDGTFTYLIGGNNGTKTFGDIWRWDDTTWTRIV